MSLRALRRFNGLATGCPAFAPTSVLQSNHYYWDWCSHAFKCSVFSTFLCLSRNHVPFASSLVP